LGLKFIFEDDFALVLDANGIRVRVAKAPEFKPAPFTILGWEVSGIENMGADLMKKGVRFEKFGMPGHDDVGIWRAPSGAKVAWFKDPDCNVLSLSQHP
jgi:hypothetical protein